METLGKRVREARISAAMTQAELAKKIGVTKSSISQWETGTTKAMDGSKLIALSKATNVSPEWLSEGRLPRNRIRPGAENAPVTHLGNASSIDNLAAKVPLISWVSAGKLCEAIDNYAPGDAEEWLPCPIKCGHNTFALRVEGDSMTSMIAGAKTYPSGCIIYVDPGVQVRNGSRVVASIDGHVTFKIYREDAGERWLMPINTQYEKMQLSAGVTICGVVIAKYEPE
jgi:SOS-response transcriptional repressor LexA